MNVRFYVDPETETPHVYRHGIDEEEVIDVLSSPGEVGQFGKGRALESARREQDVICG